eukprot:38564-Rhodomonas_salina.2
MSATVFLSPCSVWLFEHHVLSSPGMLSVGRLSIDKHVRLCAMRCHTLTCCVCRFQATSPHIAGSVSLPPQSATRNPKPETRNQPQPRPYDPTFSVPTRLTLLLASSTDPPTGPTFATETGD